MKKSLFILVLIFSIFLSTSCKKDPDKLSFNIIKNEADIDSLWLFTLENHLIGINPYSLERKLDVKFNYTFSNPKLINNKLYLGEKSRGNGNFGDKVLCFNKNLSLEDEIPVLPNVWNMYQADNFLVTDSWCYYNQLNSGYSVINLETNKTVYTYDKLNEVMCNADTVCSYNGKLYIGSFQQSVNGKPFAITVLDLKTLKPELENSTIFCEKEDEYKNWAFSNILIYKNQLWIDYFYHHLICVYDLDTHERIARINLKSDYNIPELANEAEQIILDENNQVSEASTTYYVMRLPQIINGKYHVLLRKEYQDEGLDLNDILVINTDTFELEKEIRLNKDLPGASEIKYSLTDSNSIYVRSFNVIDEFAIDSGKLISSTVVLDKN